MAAKKKAISKTKTATKSEPSSLVVHLRELVDALAGRLGRVEKKKMLVSVGWMVDGRTFALVSREGRIVVRLPDAEAERELLAEGGEPWVFGERKPPRGWLLLPESTHDDDEALAAWLRRAHALNASTPRRLQQKKKPKTKTKQNGKARARA